MPAYTETIDFNSCYSHWKLNPRPSLRKSCKKSSSVDSGEDFPAQHSPMQVNPKASPKIELKVPKLKKAHKKKKRDVAHDFCQQLMEQGRNHPAFTESQPGMGMQISFTEVVINSMEDFKKVPKESILSKKPPVWNATNSGMPTMIASVPSCDYMSNPQQSSLILQQILSEEKRFDDQVEQQTRAVLECIHENRLARLQELHQKAQQQQVQQAPQHAQPMRLRSGPGVSFPLSRIPSLEKLQFNMQPSTTAGHNFAGFPYFGPDMTEYPSFKGQYTGERSTSSTHVPLSAGRTASFEKMLSYWQDCAEPAIVVPVEVTVKAEPCPVELEVIPEPALIQPPSFEDFLSDDCSSSPFYSSFEDECHSPADLHFVDQVLSV